MDFTSPQPWSEILRAIAGWDLVPTAEGSAAISTWPQQIRALSVYSARTTLLPYLEKLQQVTADFAAGKINMATAKMELQDALQSFGYTPEGGFPGDEGKVPPAATQLQNLASDKRIKLVVNTLATRAQSTAYLQQSMTGDDLFYFPCWEFLRLGYRKHPRGESGRETDPGWHDRWVRSGGKLYDGRMIAAKDDDVWENISDSSIWPDGLDSDSDPVVFNTGYGRIEVPRRTCVKLGVIGADDNVEAHNISLLGTMFDDPAKATLGDIKANRADLVAALAMLEDAA